MKATNRNAWGIAAVAALLLSQPALAGEVTAITGGTLHPASGEPVANVTVLIEDGFITAVGTDLEVPYDADVVDATGKVLFPGMVLAHTSSGVDRANESLPVTPFVDVRDSLDPSSTFFEDALRAGVTTLHVIQGNDTVIAGLSRIVRPVGMMVEDMTVRPMGGIKISISPKNGLNRMTHMATLRKAFADLEDHLRQVAERRYEEEQKKADKKVLVPPDEAAEKGMEHVRLQDLDEKWRTLWRVSKGEIPVFLNVETAQDVLRGISWAKDHGLLEQTTFVLGTEAWKVADAIQATGRPVILDGNLVHRETDPLTGEETETFVPKVFADAGVPFSLQTWRGVMGEDFLWYQAARLVREGLSRDAALAAITQAPADTIGLGDKAGAVEAGRYGNVLILSGDPLAQSTVVEKVVLEGKVAYDRSQDRRLQRLLTGDDASTATDNQ